MEIITAVISAVVTLSVCMINNYCHHRSMEQLLVYRLTELEKKVGKHNNLVDRTYKLEQQQSLTDEKMNVLNNNLEALERKVEKDE